MPLTAGTRLGPYEILAPLGAGGMGEVYRARDPRLGREVAIKVLPAESLRDDAARARLLREARLAATLNHPNICTIHEVGEAGGHVYIAMELIEGRPLSEAIAERRGGLPTENVTRYGMQIAAALTHAHEKHVIHRDLKSSNVVITPDGRAKVLDFGVARRAYEASDASSTTLSVAPTETGAVVGTPHYLAPEVLRGGTADERSDLWALGVLLQEMASGALPFNGTTGYELASAILHDTPAALPDRVPSGLRAVIGRCLAKEPGERYQRASELRAALEALQSGASATTAARATMVSRALPVALTVLGLIAAAAAIWYVRQQSAAPRELKQRQVTSNAPSDPVGTGVISPDGKTLAVVDFRGLSLRSIESGESHRVELPAGFTFSSPFFYLSWFPDGSQILVSGHMADGRLAVWALPMAGGRARKILDDASFANCSPEGAHIAFRRDGPLGSEICVCGANGEDAHRVTGDDSTGVIPTWATWSPNGKRLLYGRVALDAMKAGPRFESCDLSGRARLVYAPTAERPIHLSAVPLWLPDGRIVFDLTDPPPNQRDMNLWSLRVDPRSGAPSGSPRRITQWQRLALVQPTACTTNGKRLSVWALEYQSDVYAGRVVAGDSLLHDVRRVTLDDRMDLAPSWMPDDSTIVFCSDRSGTLDLFRQRVGGASAEPLVTGPGDQSSPRLSPDQAWILYREEDEARGPGTPGAGGRIMRIPATGGPPGKVLDLQGFGRFRTPQSRGTSPVLCELRNSTLVFSEFDPLQGRGRELARVKGDEPPIWDVSPDGSTIAMLLTRRDSIPSIHLISTSGAPKGDIRLDRTVQIDDIAYGADGHSWLVVAFQDMWQLLHVDARGRTTSLIPPQLWMYSATASPDGKHVAYTTNTVQSNIWMLEDY